MNEPTKSPANRPSTIQESGAGRKGLLVAVKAKLWEEASAMTGAALTGTRHPEQRADGDPPCCLVQVFRDRTILILTFNKIGQNWDDFRKGEI